MEIHWKELKEVVPFTNERCVNYIIIFATKMFQSLTFFV